MQKNTRDFDRKHLNASPEDRVHNEIDGKLKALLQRGERRGIVALLALLLLVLSAFIALSGMGRAYAQGDCLVLCPAASSTLTPAASPTLTTTPASSPTAAPTPKPSPTARPTQKPTPVPTAAIVISPTASASLSPTSTTASPEVGATPDRTETTVSAASLTRGNSGNPPASTGFSGLALVAGSVVMALLLLFLGGGLAWRSVRRALVPLAKVKLPPSGAQPWSRYRAPDPGDFPPAPVPALADAETTFLPFAANEHLSALADTDTDQIPPVL